MRGSLAAFSVQLELIAISCCLTDVVMLLWVGVFVRVLGYLLLRIVTNLQSGHFLVLSRSMLHITKLPGPKWTDFFFNPTLYADASSLHKRNSEDTPTQSRRPSRRCRQSDRRAAMR